MNEWMRGHMAWGIQGGIKPAAGCLPSGWHIAVKESCSIISAQASIYQLGFS
jgi:hypothetical protein